MEAARAPTSSCNHRSPAPGYPPCYNARSNVLCFRDLAQISIMEDDRENRRKRKVVDIPEASASASSVPVILPKKRKVEESTVTTNSPHDAGPAENTDLKENIKKLVKAIKNYVRSSSELDKAVGAIRELKQILSGNNAKKRAKIMVKKKTVTRLIKLLIKSSTSETLTVDVEIMDASALGLLTCLAKHSKRARRTIIDERTIHHLLPLISRQHILADDEFIFRVQLAGLKLFRVLLQSSAEETVRALLALRENGGAFVSGFLLSLSSSADYGSSCN